VNFKTVKVNRRDFLRSIALAGGLAGLKFDVPAGYVAVAGRFYTIEIHDIAVWDFKPGYLQKLDDILDKFGVFNREYFVIPASGDLKNEPDFLNYLKSKIIPKYKIGQHGLTHDFDQNKNPEYSGLNYADAAKRNQEGIKLMEQFLGVVPDRFAFPYWSRHPEALRATVDMYKLVHELHVIIQGGPARKNAEILVAGVTDFTREPESKEKALKNFEDHLNYFEPAVLRILLHPQDTKFEGFEAILSGILSGAQKAGYEPIITDKLFGL